MSVIVAYVVELAAVGESPVVSSRIGLANLINDDESMMIFRIVGFALFPLLMAAIESGLVHRPVNRDTLRQPFYAQCFLAAPFVLALSLAITAIRRPEAWMEPVAFAAALVASALYVVAEATWLVRATKRSWMLAAPSALAGYIACMLILGIASALLGGE